MNAVAGRERLKNQIDLFVTLSEKSSEIVTSVVWGLETVFTERRLSDVVAWLGRF